ncbi:SDR family NAD(P)-dependent oxidoreductase [Luteitalea sp. TBR-22]|uniref:SDR family NAD(P)-dependent oxidoreductase n=1 Tax=Luteitalea sp. TBR-22 TaxID=2802971 RepID=UPI00351D4A6A
MPAPPRPDHRIVLVTGSTDRLGHEVARRLAAQGAHVIVHGRNTERGKAVVDESAGLFSLAVRHRIPLSRERPMTCGVAYGLHRA